MLAATQRPEDVSTYIEAALQKRRASAFSECRREAWRHSRTFSNVLSLLFDRVRAKFVDGEQEWTGAWPPWVLGILPGCSIRENGCRAGYW